MTLEVARHPFELIPKEIWNTIFKKLNSSDVINCCRANISWNDMFTDDKQLLLIDEVFPLLHSYLKKADTLNYRRVCKPWKYAFDVFYGDLVTPLNFDNYDKYMDPYQLRVGRRRKEEYQLCNNPPPSHSFLYKSTYLQDRFDNSVFLQNFGESVEKLEYFASYVGPTSYLNKVQELLQYVPNLVMLFLRGKEVSYDAVSLRTRQGLWTRAVERFMSQYFLPDLPKLQSLEVFLEADHSHCGGQHNAIIRRYAGQLKRLCIYGEGPVDLPQLPQLEYLQMAIASRYELTQLLELNSNLKEIHLCIQTESTVGELVELVNKFGQSLEKCSLSLKNNLIADIDNRKPQVVAAKVKHFKLRKSSPKLATDFVKGFSTSLEELEICFEDWSVKPLCDDDNAYFPLKEIFGGESEQGAIVYSLKVWEDFPKLRRLRLSEFSTRRVVNGTRRMYDYLKPSSA